MSSKETPKLLTYCFRSVFSEPPGYFLETSFKGDGDTEVQNVQQKLSPLDRLSLPPDVRMLRGIPLEAKYSAFVYPASNKDYTLIESRLISEEEDKVRWVAVLSCGA